MTKRVPFETIEFCESLRQFVIVSRNNADEPIKIPVRISSLETRDNRVLVRTRDPEGGDSFTYEYLCESETAAKQKFEEFVKIMNDNFRKEHPLWIG